MALTFACVACNQAQFTLSSESIENQDVPIVTFLCPKCGEHTAVSRREGGGILIQRDEHVTSRRRS